MILGLQSELSQTCQNAFRGDLDDECTCLSQIEEDVATNFRCYLEADSLQTVYQDWFSCINAGEDCSDTHEGEISCSQYEEWNYCNEGYEEWMALNCEATCGFCEEVVVDGCEDIHSGAYTCAQYKEWNYCEVDYVSWMEENCPKTCGVCGKNKDDSSS